jgi:5-methylcytosine-specific restriction enzyme A
MERYCEGSPQCRNTVVSGVCPDCRKTRTRVVYSRRWAQYSKRRLAEHPWCVGYPAGVHQTPRLAECTDHIKSARQYPELHWEPTNHQSLCRACNVAKAIAEEGGFGRD